METEVTVRVYNSLQETLDILKNLGFTLKEKVFLKDCYFSGFSLKDLQKMDYSTLIKNSFIVRNVLDGEDKTFICYKNKVLDSFGNVLKEEKTTVKVLDFLKTVTILKNANLTNWCNLDQEMFILEKDNISFALQNVLDLGVFIELEEYEEIKQLTEQEKIDKMYNYLKNLGLNLGVDFSCKKVFLKFKKI